MTLKITSLYISLIVYASTNITYIVFFLIILMRFVFGFWITYMICHFVKYDYYLNRLSQTINSCIMVTFSIFHLAYNSCQEEKSRGDPKKKIYNTMHSTGFQIYLHMHPLD